MQGAAGLGTRIHRGAAEAKQAASTVGEAGPGTRAGQVPRLAFLACQAGMVAGETVSLVGLALAQASLDQGGVPFPPVPLGQLAKKFLYGAMCMHW